ncbi:uncharacterized WD repeat-containing protein C1306.02-like [Pollicipes pollicipes]|uniref:uncharacterized WD repeat-containing protein C1306.02-like n=1 Tax=Pollicipes pollicipes TaxID=41117 RepID=UPI001885288E|nr:uncharacterized WD repeat-containing protein C1306.02-like [Pollicipes pollicipes]
MVGPRLLRRPSQFVLWSVAAERELWRVTCGGGHRSWALSVSSDALWLSWVSERQVRHVSCLLADLQTSVIKSGVNALSVRPAPGGAVQLLTGGDDGALCLSQLRTNGARPRLETAARQTGAHTSQITAVLWLPDGRLLSVSVDQRVCVWSERAGQLRLDSTRLTAVADAKGALLWTEDGTVMVLVYGEGLELLRLEVTELTGVPAEGGRLMRLGRAV